MTLAVTSVNNFVISHQVVVLVIFTVVAPSMLFINYKLLRIVRKCRRNNTVSPEMKKAFSTKNISTCLQAVACFVILSIPAFVYIGIKMSSSETSVTLDNANLVGIWAKTIASMNGTFKSLPFVTDVR